MEKLDYVLGLDLGVASIGWAVMEIDENNEPVNLVDANSVIFEPLDNDKGKLYNVDRRNARGARRILNRRKERIRRTKNLLTSSGFLSDDELSKLYSGQIEDIFEIRKKGLTEQLNKNEIARLMIFYNKNRGFKSNRKTDDLELEEELKKLEKNNGKISEKASDNNANDEKKLKPLIALNTKRLQEENLMPIELIFKLKSEEDILGFKNKEGVYKFGFKRDQIEKEIEYILERQELVSEELLEKYMEILKSQRDFSEGPAEPSNYRINWESKTGACKYTGEKRVVAGAPSYEIFCMLQKLTDLRYIYIADETKKGKFKLEKEHLDKIYNKALKTKKVTYKDVLDILNDENVRILNVPQLEIKEYKKIKEKFQGELTEDQIKELNNKLNTERHKISIFELKQYKELLAQFKKNDITEDNIEELGGIALLDKVAELLTYAKTDKKLEEYHTKDRYKDIPKEIIEKIKTFKTLNKTGNLSLNLVRKLNEKMLEGNDYEKSLSNLGYSIKINDNWDKFPTVSQIEEAFNTKITNPNVKHIMVILRKLYNTLLEKYGKPKKVHLELARDMANDFSTRIKIKKEQEKNRAYRELKSFEVYSNNLDIVGHKNKLSNDDILRFRLYDEQNGICIYSGQKIDKSKLRTSEYQVDHILPYSKSADNSFENKVLVYAKENQDKKERTPYQWLKGTQKWLQFKHRVELNTHMKDKKKNNLLFTDEVKIDEFLDRDLHATSYSSRLALQVFKSLISPDERDIKDENALYIYHRNVVAFNGSMTSQLRSFYGLNRFTHSFESEDLRIGKNYRIDEIKYTKDELILVAKNEKRGLEISENRKIEYTDKSKKTFKTETDRIIFEEIIRKENIDNISNELKGKYVEDITEKDFRDILDKNENIPTELISTIYQLNSLLKQDINSKNRENHLHHALDATLLTIMNHSMQQRLTKFNQILQKMSNSPEEYVDEETGEIMTYKEAVEKLREDIDVKYIDLYNKKATQTYKIPGTNEKISLSLPYVNFIEDIKNIIFIKDENDSSFKLPYHVFKKKTSGQLHAETILGESKGLVTKRVSVFDIKDSKNLEKLFDKDGSQKEIYETLLKWLEEKSKDYPKLKNGHIIKKVKMVDENKDKLIKLGEKRYVQMGQTTVKILVLKKKDEDGYRMASIGRYNYNKIKKGEDFKLHVWKSANKADGFINYSDIENHYCKLFELHPSELIELENQKGGKIKCKVTGFTGGYLEVKSIIGDSTDLIRNSVFDGITKDNRFRKPISTISKISKVKYNILGDKVCHLGKY